MKKIILLCLALGSIGSLCSQKKELGISGSLHPDDLYNSIRFTYKPQNPKWSLVFSSGYGIRRTFQSRYAGLQEIGVFREFVNLKKTTVSGGLISSLTHFRLDRSSKDWVKFQSNTLAAQLAYGGRLKVFGLGAFGIGFFQINANKPQLVYRYKVEVGVSYEI